MGKFARFCVQVNLLELLPLFLKIDKMHLNLVHEGVTSLYFGCGMVGQRESLCQLRRVQAVQDDIVHEKAESAKDKVNEGEILLNNKL